MLCNISQNDMGQLGGYPARSSWGGTLPGPAGGGTLAGGVPWPGGYPGQGGTLARGYPARGTLAGEVPCWGVPCQWGTLLGGVPS